MSLFDSLLSSVLGGDKTPVLAQLAGQLINQHGSGQGLAGLVQQFQQNGLGDLVQSWVGTGQNQPISAGQVQQALGPEQIQRFAEQSGLASHEVSAALAQILPQVIDRLTPGGQVPAHHEVQNLFGALLQGLGK